VTISLPGVVVTVIDSTTGIPAATGAYGAIAKLGRVYQLWPYGSRGIPPNDTLISLAATPSNPGEYRVTVSKGGYQTWEMRDVRVTETDCGFATTNVTAKLKPAS
jgi:hypothetical protein